jgi:hypothetical protein
VDLPAQALATEGHTFRCAKTKRSKALPLCRRRGPRRAVLLVPGCNAGAKPKGAKRLMIAFVFAFLLVISEEAALRGVEWRIYFCLLPLHLFFAFSAQKSDVKSQNHPKTCQPTHNKIHISSRQSAF